MTSKSFFKYINSNLWSFLLMNNESSQKADKLKFKPFCDFVIIPLFTNKGAYASHKIIGPLMKIPKLSLKNIITQEKYIIFATEIKVHE